MRPRCRTTARQLSWRLRLPRSRRLLRTRRMLGSPCAARKTSWGFPLSRPILARLLAVHVAVRPTSPVLRQPWASVLTQVSLLVRATGWSRLPPCGPCNCRSRRVIRPRANGPTFARMTVRVRPWGTTLLGPRSQPPTAVSSRQSRSCAVRTMFTVRPRRLTMCCPTSPPALGRSWRAFRIVARGNSAKTAASIGPRSNSLPVRRSPPRRTRAQPQAQAQAQEQAQAQAQAQAQRSHR